MSNYPNALDNLAKPTGDQKLSTGHADMHTRVSESVEAVQSTLGVNPQGSSGTVAARLAGVESEVEHDHDDEYSATGHGHPHDHDTEYAAEGHTHSGSGHDHDTEYEALDAGPQGELGYAVATSVQSPITSEADLTSLSVTVDIPANRRIRIIGYGIFDSSVAGDRTIMRIKEGTTQLQFASETHGAATTAGRIVLQPMLTITPSEGSHTYKLTAERGTGTGNVSLQADAARPCFIQVEDLGPA